MFKGVEKGRFQLQRERRISILCKNIPKYELLVRTQKIFSGSTIVSAWIDGEMSTSHHSSIVAQYHHSRTKLYILAMDLIASTAVAAAVANDTVDNGFDSAAAAASDADECEFGSLFVASVGLVDATIVAVVVVIVVVVSSIKNN